MTDLPTAQIRPFSLRHQKAISSGRIRVILPDRLRSRLWLTMTTMDEQIGYTTKDNPNWWNSTSAIEEADREYARLLGISVYDSNGHRVGTNLQAVVQHGDDHSVLDVIEVYMALHGGGPVDLRAVQRSINDAFVDFACP